MELVLGQSSAWEDFVASVSNRCWYRDPGTPGRVLKSYRYAVRELEETKKRLAYPINKRDGNPLSVRTIKTLQSQERRLTKDIAAHKKLIKHLAKHNLLPIHPLITDKDRRQFVFSLQAMIELPEFGKAVFYANRLLSLRHDDIIPATNKDTDLRYSILPGCINDQSEHRSRESLYNALVDTLQSLTTRIEKGREYLIHGGTPWDAERAIRWAAQVREDEDKRRAGRAASESQTQYPRSTIVGEVRALRASLEELAEKMAGSRETRTINSQAAAVMVQTEKSQKHLKAKKIFSLVNPAGTKEMTAVKNGDRRSKPASTYNILSDLGNEFMNHHRKGNGNQDQPSA